MARRRIRTQGRRNLEGFTLIELMVVVAIIAIVAGATMPAIATAIRERKSNQAALDVVRLFRSARSTAAGTGRAHLMRFQADGDDGRGSLELWRGANNRCNGVQSSWPADSAACAGGDCIDFFSGQEHEGESSMRLNLAMQTGPTGGLVDLCMQPNGVMMWRAAATGNFVSTGFTVDGNAVAGLVFSMTRVYSGATEGVVRRILVPLGGDARILR